MFFSIARQEVVPVHTFLAIYYLFIIIERNCFVKQGCTGNAIENLIDT